MTPGSATLDPQRPHLLRLWHAASEFLRTAKARQNPATAPKADARRDLAARFARLDRITQLVDAAAEAGAIDLDTGAAVHKELDRVAATLRAYARKHGLTAPQTAAPVSKGSEADDDGETSPRGARMDETAQSAPPSGARLDLDLRDYPPVALTLAQRRAVNEAAIRVLEKPDPAITDEDRADVLRLYTGAGGLGGGEQGEELQGFLNEHYTDYAIVRLMWDKLAAMGYQAGNVLEPGAGVGGFAGFRPPGVEMVMVEKSAVSARIARLLYPRQEVHHEDFARFGEMVRAPHGHAGGTTDVRWQPYGYHLTGCIGNVPFGDYSIAGHRDPLRAFGGDATVIHDYFILKSLDMMEPGSPVMLITSTGTMDKRSRAFREAMMRRARFVGAYRLPSGTFRANAGTDITTDLLLFQVYPEGEQPVIDPAFLETVERQEHVRGETYTLHLSRYYAENPGRALGELVPGHGQQFVSRYGVKGEVDGAQLRRVLGDGLAFPYDLPPGASGRGKKPNLYRADAGLRLPDREHAHDPAGAVVYYGGGDGIKAGFYEKGGRYYRPFEVKKADAKRVRSALAVLDRYAAYVKALALAGKDGATSAEARSTRDALTAAARTHIETYGIPDADDRLKGYLRYDARAFKLYNLVREDDAGDVAFDGIEDDGAPRHFRWADVIVADRLYSDTYAASLRDTDDVAEVAAFARAQGADLSVEGLQPFYKGGTATAAEVEAALEASGLFYRDPKQRRPDGTFALSHRYDYLAGDLWPKIHAAEAAGMAANVEALKGALPPQASVFEIEASPDQVWSWLPKEAVERWLEAHCGYHRVMLRLYRPVPGSSDRAADLVAEHGKKFTGYKGTPQDLNLGWGDFPYRSIVLWLIEGKSFRRYLPVKGEDGQMHRSGHSVQREELTDEQYQLVRETQVANQDRMYRQVPADFTEWLRVNASDELRARVEQAFNERFNSFVTPPFDGSTFRVSGMSDTFYGVKNFEVYRHNLAAAEHAVWEGRFGNSHDVGAGKTLSTIVAVMGGKQRGLWRKPCYVVPGKVIEKWAKEIQMAFPDAKILNLRLAGRSKDREIALAQLEEWDAILIPTHAFTRIPLSPEEESRMIRERLAQFRRMVESYVLGAEAEGGKGVGKRERRRIEKMVAQLETRLQNLADKPAREGDVYFDQLGVDCLIYDESHFFKNALGSPEAQALGIAASKPSQRAEDALQKADFVRRYRGDEKGVFTLTATPVVNSPIEVYHMIRLVAPDVLASHGVLNLDDFIKAFVSRGMRDQRTMAGSWKPRLVVTGYESLPELRRLISRVMEVKSYDQIQAWYADHPDWGTPSFSRPEAERAHTLVEPSRVHDLLFEDIRHRATEIMECYSEYGCDPRDLDDNFLLITTEGGQISTDLRLNNRLYASLKDEAPGLKLPVLADAVATAYETRPNPGSMLPGGDDSLDGIGGHGTPISRSQEVRENRTAPAPRVWNQLIFCNYVRTRDGRSFHQLIKQALVERGIPAEEICIINGQVVGVDPKTGEDYAVRGNDDKEELKAQAQDDFNEGRYRVIIGNQTIAEGMNLDRWTTEIHHLDVPFTPSEIAQRDGRGVRQGNRYAKVRITHYLMRRSFDEHRLRLVVKKQNWIDQLFYDVSLRRVDADAGDGALSYEDMMAAVAEDPRVQRFFLAGGRLNRNRPRVNQLRAQRAKINRALQTAESDAVAREARLKKVVEDERAVLDAVLPASAEEALSSGGLVLKQTAYGSGPAYPLPPSMQEARGKVYGVYAKLTITDERELRPLELRILITANTSNEGAAASFKVVPDRDADQRRYWGAGTWMGLSGTNAWVEIANEADFAAHHGLDLQAEKKRKRRVYDADSGRTVEQSGTWSEVKAQLGMDTLAKWWPVVQPKLAAWLLDQEREWQERAAYRLDRARHSLAEQNTAVERLEGQMAQVADEMKAVEAEIEQDEETVRSLREVVHSLTAFEHEDREAVQEAIADELARWAAEGLIELERVTIEDLRDRSGADTEDDDGPDAEGVLRDNPDDDGESRRRRKATLVYLGTLDRLDVDDGHADVTYEPASGERILLFATASGTRLIAVSDSLTALTPGGDRDEAAAKLYATWTHRAPDGRDVRLGIPHEALALHLDEDRYVGTAKATWYSSDKLMRPGDRKGRPNRYVHQHDEGRRPVYELAGGDVLVIDRVRIDAAGIHN